MQACPDEDEDEGLQDESEGEEFEGSERGVREYWDEEDEIEEYFARKGMRNGVNDNGSSSDESDEEDCKGIGAGRKLGENPSLEDLNAETQRLLREVAGSDRLGRGQKIEIKPLSSIAEKLKKRRELAIARAPQRRNRITVPNFEDILTAAATTLERGVQKEDENVSKDPLGCGDDLEIVSEQEDEEEGPEVSDGQRHLLPVFGNGGGDDKPPKTSPLVYDPYSHSRDEDEFEDEALIDDGLGSGSDSDSESERSWEVRVDVDKDVDKDAISSNPNTSGDDRTDGEPDESGEEEVEGDEEEEQVEQGPTCEGRECERHPIAEGQGLEKPVDHPAGPINGLEAIMKHAQQAQLASSLAGDKEGLTPAQLLAATDVIPPEMERLQKKFLDMEAELSDEEGAAAPVSDDEDENNLDDHGELADLITHDKFTDKDRQKAEDLHLQWARQKDAKDLQLVLRGLENGFRGRRGGGLDGNDEELKGRWRRARVDDDDDFGSSIAAFAWPTAFAMGGNTNNNNNDGEEEECEDDLMLHKAKQQRLIREGESREGLARDQSMRPIPLDDDSRMFLNLLARSASDSQQVQCPLQTKGLNGIGASIGPLVAKPSFVGRQSLATKKSGSSALIGPNGGRSFVFGRSENSNSSNAQDEKAVKGSADGGVGKDENVGPTNFANLRQLAGLTGPVNRGQKSKSSKGSLVSRLKSQNSTGGIGSQESLAAVHAVCKLTNDSRRTIA